MSGWLGYTKQNFGQTGGSFVGAPPRIVMHTTEGVNWPEYDGGKMAPHFTAWWDGAELHVRQHSSLDAAAFALVHPPVCQTNRANAYQIELIGTCAPGGPGMHWPTAPDAALKAVGGLLQKIMRYTGTPGAVYGTWQDYPASAGAGASQRMSPSRWMGFTGICGHQHVPGNDHGDPGRLPVARMLELSGMVVAESKPKGPQDWVTLRQGDTGSSVRFLQAQLKKRGAKVAVDGDFGGQTFRAVEGFQQAHHLAVDGVVGPQTWVALMEATKP